MINRATVFCRNIPEVTFSICQKKDGNSTGSFVVFMNCFLYFYMCSV